MSRWIHRVAVVLLVACGGGSDGPVSPPVVPPPAVTPPSTNSGVLIVTLETPNADDGGVLIDVTGPGIMSLVVPGASYESYRTQSTGKASALLAGNIQSGDVLEVHVADVSKASEYHAVLRQAASTAFELRSSLEGYSVSIHPQAGS